MDFTYYIDIAYNKARGDIMSPTQLNRLVKRLQSGDMDVFDSIYHETKKPVYHTILAILKDRSLSEDIMQDTYLKALAKIHSFTPRYSFTSWIVTIARNLALNEYKRRQREVQIDVTENENLFGTTEENAETQLIVEEMLNSVSEEEREVIILHVVADLKHREIAEILGKPLGTITWMYNNAINKIKQEFGKERF
jgi:RNA polymerase sigma-70 factor (ECF subfamily)